jgi:hypothetical protein
MKQILQTVLQDQPIASSAAQQADVDDSENAEQSTAASTQGKKRPTDRDENGQIGESTRAKPLTKQQKKRALYVHGPSSLSPSKLTLLPGRWNKRDFL